MTRILVVVTPLGCHPISSSRCLIGKNIEANNHVTLFDGVSKLHCTIHTEVLKNQ